MRRNKQWDVNKAMLLSRLFQFLHCAGKACVIPFLTLYLRHLGLTASLTGIIMGTKHFINLAWAPLSGYFAKHYNKRRVVILSSLLCSIGTGLLLLLIPPADKATMTRYCNINRDKSKEDKLKEEELLQQIHKLVETRDFLVDDVEFERLREREEDKEMADFLQSKLPTSCIKKTNPIKDKKLTSRAQQTSTPFTTKTGLTLLKECCGFTCSIM
ncbi:UNVERIFIED_CONTAM: hypothetical protein FKN15_071236 [Acipenser sinensis]